MQGGGGGTPTNAVQGEGESPLPMRKLTLEYLWQTCGMTRASRSMPCNAVHIPQVAFNKGATTIPSPSPGPGPGKCIWALAKCTTHNASVAHAPAETMLPPGCSVKAPQQVPSQAHLAVHEPAQSHDGHGVSPRVPRPGGSTGASRLGRHEVVRVDSWSCREGGAREASGPTPSQHRLVEQGGEGHVRSFRANPPHGIDTQTRRRQSCAHDECSLTPRTIGDDVDAVWGEAGPQHRVLLAGVGDADGLVHVGQHALE